MDRIKGMERSILYILFIVSKTSIQSIQSKDVATR